MNGDFRSLGGGLFSRKGAKIAKVRSLVVSEGRAVVCHPIFVPPSVGHIQRLPRDSAEDPTAYFAREKGAGAGVIDG